MRSPWVKWALYVLVGSWVVAMFLGSTIARIIMFIRPPKPRTCPKCGYAEVYDVRLRRPTAPAKTPIAYAMCKACKRQYKHWGDGPFHSVADDEWLQVMRSPFG